MMRRRRIDQATIARLTTENRALAAQLEETARLADARYDLLRAVYRENEALRVELCSPRAAVVAKAVETAPMPRMRSRTPGIDLTRPGDETELLMTRPSAG